MRPIVLTLCAAAAGLAGCTPTATAPTFESTTEEACYNRAVAALGAGQRLVRNPAGGFVIVSGSGGFTRDAQVSQTFNRCMDGSLGEADGVVEGVSISLTPEEQAIWNRLTDAQKRQALIFKQRGGNLRDFKG